MPTIALLRTSALLAVLLLAGAAAAQPPDPKPGPPREIVRSAPVRVEDVVERIMAFDKNKDGKVTRDELPERMHHLVALGDTNKDGGLDRDEIEKLATALASAPGGPGGVRAITIDRADTLVGGFGGGQVRVGFRQQIRDVGFGPGSGPGVIEGVVDDLKLSGKKKDQAMAAARAHEENVRKLMAQARAELLAKLKEILSAEEWQDFKAALDRPRGATAFVGPPPPPDAPRR
jgi:predicted Rdx family selenoprotein